MKIENIQIKSLFLIDGIGAILSAFLLGVVLVRLEIYFGIPKSTLYFLAVLPCFFAIYDFYCYFIIEQNLSKHLRIIAMVNLLYCILSLGLALHHIDVISLLGWIYITVEVIIVVVIAFVEMRSSRLCL